MKATESCIQMNGASENAAKQLKGIIQGKSKGTRTVMKQLLEKKLRELSVKNEQKQTELNRLK